MTTKQKLLQIMLASFSLLCTPPAMAENSVNFKTENELRAEIGKLHQKGKIKYDALFELIDYASPELFRVGSIFTLSEHPDWVNKAAQAVNALSTNEADLTYCLEHGTLSAKYWAINCASMNKKFVPQLLKTAIGDSSSSVRQKALESLPNAEKQKAISELKNRRQTDPYLLKTLFPKESEFNTQLAKLLRDSDSKIREAGLSFISADGTMGLMPQIQHSFNGEVYKEIIRLTESKIVAEKAAAAAALNRMSGYDSTMTREAFLRLSRDPDPDIRWRSAAGLVSQRGQKDVDEMFARLLKDPSPTVRYMTIVSLPDRAKYQKELEALGDSVKAIKMPPRIVPVNSAAAAAWVGHKTTASQFLLVSQPTRQATERSAHDELDDMCNVIREYVSDLKSIQQKAKAEAINKRFDICMKDANDAASYQSSRQQLSEEKTAIQKSDLYVVSAFSRDWPRKDRQYERSVRVCNTGVPLTLALMAGDQEGTKWHVTLDKGVDLQKIVLSGNGHQTNSVEGNFPKSTPILKGDPNGTPFMVWLADEVNTDQRGMRLASFCVSHFGQDATTIQIRKDLSKDPSTHVPIVVGPSDSDWRLSLKTHLLEPIYKEAISAKNAKFRAKFEGEFPLIVGTPAEAGWEPTLNTNTAWCSHLEGKIKAKIADVNIKYQLEYAGLAYDPNSHKYYFASRRQVFLVAEDGSTKAILPPEFAKLFESDTIHGVAFDTKRNRLLVCSGKQSLSFQPVEQKWTKLTLDPWACNLACYSAETDSLYGRSRNWITRLDPQTGKILESGFIPISDDILLKQMKVIGDFVVFISESFPVPNGVRQLITVIDKRDGSILYQDVCFFAKTT